MDLKRYRVLIFCLALFTLLLLFYLYQQSQHNFIYSEDLIITDNHLLDSIPQKLLNLSFKYILNNENLCSNLTDEVLAVFIVTSYFGNVETRTSMRKAFGTNDLKKHKLRRVFLLGEAPQDKYITQESVFKENEQYQDIIQGNFLEAYRNLTYKHIMGLKWASTFCTNAKYIIKMDDDIVVNMYRLKAMINSLEKIKNDFIAGYVLRNLKPLRDPTNKWYVTKEEYPFNTYPSFVSGWFYITNLLSARKIAVLSNYEKYFWIDDVFVTGIVAKKLKISQFDIRKYFTVNSEYLQCCL